MYQEYVKLLSLYVSILGFHKLLIVVGTLRVPSLIKKVTKYLHTLLRGSYQPSGRNNGGGVFF